MINSRYVGYSAGFSDPFLTIELQAEPNNNSLIMPPKDM